MRRSWTVAMVVAATLIGPLPAPAEPLPDTTTYQPTVSERLRLAQRQLQAAAVRLRKAQDFGGIEANQQLDAARQSADQAAGNIEEALIRLHQTPDGDAARQAIRDVRMKLKGTQEAMAGARIDAPDAAILALRDLIRATQQVESAAQLAGRPGSGGAGRSQ